VDSLTQLILGAAVGEAVLGTIPDLDVLPGQFMDLVTRIEIHRGMTPSLLFFVAVAPLLGWPVSKLHTKWGANWRDWTQLFFWGLFTHALLDCFTTLGTQLFWPFSSYAVALNSIFVIDPLYTLPLLVCVIWLLFLPGGHRLRRRLNLVGLTMSSVYLIFTLANKSVMNHRFEAILTAQQVDWLPFETRPTPLNNILWAVTAETDDGYYIGYHSFLDGQRQAPLWYFRKNHELLQPYLHDHRVRRLVAVTEGYYTVEPGPNGIILNDLPFGQSGGWHIGQGRFVFSCQIKHHGNPGEIEVDKQKLAQFWRRIRGV